MQCPYHKKEAFYYKLEETVVAGAHFSMDNCGKELGNRFFPSTVFKVFAITFPKNIRSAASKRRTFKMYQMTKAIF